MTACCKFQKVCSLPSTSSYLLIHMYEVLFWYSMWFHYCRKLSDKIFFVLSTDKISCMKAHDRMYLYMDILQRFVAVFMLRKWKLVPGKIYTTIALEAKVEDRGKAASR